MKRTCQKGFTLVEIMIVVAIIALLAAIAIPNLLRARITANDANARATIKSMSTGAETYATANNGNYPTTITLLSGATPPYVNLSSDYCDGVGRSGFTYNCGWGSTGYTVRAIPVTIGTTGTTTYTVTTGGVLTP